MSSFWRFPWISKKNWWESSILGGEHFFAQLFWRSGANFKVCHRSPHTKVSISDKAWWTFDDVKDGKKCQSTIFFLMTGRYLIQNMIHFEHRVKKASLMGCPIGESLERLLVFVSLSLSRTWVSLSLTFALSLSLSHPSLNLCFVSLLLSKMPRALATRGRGQKKKKHAYRSWHNDWRKKGLQQAFLASL